jgi:hypothetical protein
MKSDKPFRKSFACGGVLFAFVLCIAIYVGAKFSAYQFGYLFSGLCLFPSLATATWGWFSKKTWTWGRFAATLIGFVLLFAFLQMSGRANHQ